VEQKFDHNQIWLKFFVFILFKNIRELFFIKIENVNDLDENLFKERQIIKIKCYEYI